MGSSRPRVRQKPPKKGASGKRLRYKIQVNHAKRNDTRGNGEMPARRPQELVLLCERLQETSRLGQSSRARRKQRQSRCAHSCRPFCVNQEPNDSSGQLDPDEHRRGERAGKPQGFLPVSPLLPQLRVRTRVSAAPCKGHRNLVRGRLQQACTCDGGSSENAEGPASPLTATRRSGKSSAATIELMLLRCHLHLVSELLGPCPFGYGFDPTGSRCLSAHPAHARITAVAISAEIQIAWTDGGTAPESESNT